MEIYTYEFTEVRSQGDGEAGWFVDRITELEREGWEVVERDDYRGVVKLRRRVVGGK